MRASVPLLRSANRRTGRALGAVTLLFLADTFATPCSGTPDAALAVLGVAALAFVARAIATHCAKDR